ncbi:MAG TPA: restriction endonuclease [Luteibacter sp.]|uniref:restriction endonuclease n=1 Tax=Luteibacter sp. TaxID=1886636 RepID=UPI002CDA646F|nr:restriction endonuclease [Luteibacter sp.]HVI55841.1 restriction endonuclease [Luteibacter sp.]
MKSVRHRHDDALSRVTWGAFEHLVAEHFRRQGYRVEHTGTGDGSTLAGGGIDLKLTRDQELVVVQCKHWNSFQVPHDDVHQLIGVMHTVGATGAIVISSGEFTTVAIEAAAKFRHIKLIDGKTIRAMLGPVPEPMDDAPAFAEIAAWAGTARPAVRHANTRQARIDRASAIAAVAAVLVMSGALVVLYTFYIREIQQAQMAKLLETRQPTVSPPQTAASLPSVLPGLTSAMRASIETARAHPVVVHGTPVARDVVAEWNDKPPVTATIKDQ